LCRIFEKRSLKHVVEGNPEFCRIRGQRVGIVAGEAEKNIPPVKHPVFWAMLMQPAVLINFIVSPQKTIRQKK